MKRENFNQGYALLLNSFPHNKNTPETQEAYWSMLQDVPGERFIEGVKECLSTCNFFPTIAELGSTSMGTSNWFQSIERRKRLAADKQRLLEPALSKDQIERNRAAIRELSANLGRGYSVK